MCSKYAFLRAFVALIYLKFYFPLHATLIIQFHCSFRTFKWLFIYKVRSNLKIKLFISIFIQPKPPQEHQTYLTTKKKKRIKRFTASAS